MVRWLNEENVVRHQVKMIVMKGLLAILILSYSSTAFGQFSQKELMLNGTFLLNSELNPHALNGGPSKPLNSFAVKPSVGFFYNKEF